MRTSFFSAQRTAVTHFGLFSFLEFELRNEKGF